MKKTKLWKWLDGLRHGGRSIPEEAPGGVESDLMPDSKKTPHGASIFREGVLERLTSSEQLDRLLVITSPKAWIALLVLCGLLALGVVWAFVGRISTEVKGSGILMLEEGAFTISSQTDGQVENLYFAEGEFLERGDSVAVISDPKRLLTIQKTRRTLRKLETKREQLLGYRQRFSSMKEESQEEQHRNILKDIEELQQQIEWLQERHENQEKVFEKGLITRKQLLETLVSMDSNRQSVRAKRDSLMQIELSRIKELENLELEIIDLELKIAMTEEELQNLEDEFLLLSTVVSPYTGRVVDLDVTIGSSVETGSPLMTLELEKEGSVLEAVMFFPASQGEQVTPGLIMTVVPGMVQVDQYGCLVAKTTVVTPFPVTEEHVNQVLQNANMVASVMKNGAPVEVRAVLIPDPRTPSGFLWTSSQGPDFQIQPGMVANGSVVVNERKPVSLVIPLFRKWILGQTGEDTGGP